MGKVGDLDTSDGEKLGRDAEKLSRIL